MRRRVKYELVVNAKTPRRSARSAVVFYCAPTR